LATFADFFFEGLIMDWIVQSRINKSLNHVRNMASDVSHILGKLRQELQMVENRLAEGYKKKQAIIEGYKFPKPI